MKKTWCVVDFSLLQHSNQWSQHLGPPTGCILVCSRLAAVRFANLTNLVWTWTRPNVQVQVQENHWTKPHWRSGFRTLVEPEPEVWTSWTWGRRVLQVTLGARNNFSIKHIVKLCKSDSFYTKHLLLSIIVDVIWCFLKIFEAALWYNYL